MRLCRVDVEGAVRGKRRGMLQRLQEGCRRVRPGGGGGAHGNLARVMHVNDE